MEPSKVLEVFALATGQVCSASLCHSSCILSCFSRVQVFAAPWTVAQQASLSIEFSRQEY